MELANYLDEQYIKLDLKGKTHDEVISELVDVLCVRCGNGTREEVLKSIYNVEDIKNTAVGRGVAIPHGRTDAVPRIIVVLGRSSRGIEWGAPDGVPVRLVWLIVNPPHHSNIYLDCLSQITKLSVRKNAREGMLVAKSPEQVIKIVKEHKCRRSAR
jgi:mannitol/fructose-specific phosphotransferase system IIA component (Ntr-type)